MEYAADSLKIRLTADDVSYLEEMYMPHPVVGAIKQNHNINTKASKITLIETGLNQS